MTSANDTQLAFGNAAHLLPVLNRVAGCLLIVLWLWTLSHAYYVLSAVRICNINYL